MPVHVVRLFSPISLLFVLITSLAQAEESQTPILQKQLQQRDQVIIELLERVDALEKRTGVQRRTDKSSESSKENIVTTSDTESAQAPGAVIVSEADAERALERSLTVEGALLLPSGILEIEPGFSYVRREDTAPGFTTIGPDVFASETEVNANIYTASLTLRWGLPWQSQLEIGQVYRRSETEAVTRISFAPVDSSYQTTSDWGDLRVGFAKTLLREDLSVPDLVGRITWDSDSGGTNSFEELQLSLTAIKRQDPVTFIAGLGYQHTFEKHSTEPGKIISTNFGGLIALNPETSMRFIFSALRQSERKQSGTEIAATDRTAASFITGGSVLLARGILLNLSIGMGLTDDAEDFSLAVSLPIRIN